MRAEALTNNPVSSASRMGSDILAYLRFYAALRACLSFAKSMLDRSGNILRCTVVRRLLTRGSVWVR